jgi:hypothetical protein
MVALDEVHGEAGRRMGANRHILPASAIGGKRVTRELPLPLPLWSRTGVRFRAGERRLFQESMDRNGSKV